ncbi:putative F-box/LRR-repeat protein [Prunus yedoensis var. nudiflora]|uniref:Putative F-box/LRR-repeat protein n=1 Tax=Prunus yedoensis var. nudiflora TaxID=2094558 RepID=A0A314ZCD7_PRUYE|nr:putative F-box/LRR-repeat protein [Prunus yedoensis var. nudiflora]
MATTNKKHKPYLPDDIIYKILRRLPTKAAVRMSSLFKQWEGVWSLLPSLDFDEGGNPDDYHHHNFVVDTENLLRHKRFVNNILAKYLEYRQKDNKQKDVLDKLKIRMARFHTDDVTLINKWLDFSFETSVKELDISLRISKLHWNIEDGGLWFYYCISRRTFFNAKSLTALNLEHVRIKSFDHTMHDTSLSLLPSLKTMRLKSVVFDNHALFSLIRECPSIESLSLASCSFEDSLSSSSLKSLEVKDCMAPKVEVDEAVNLECFTVVSSQFPLQQISLGKSNNLRYIHIRAQHLQRISLSGCHQTVKATIDTPNLVSFYFNGYVSYSNFHVKAPNLKVASIRLLDHWDEELSTIDRPWKHFPTLRDFLKEFGCSKELTLLADEFKGIIFPENFRKIFSSPLPYANVLIHTRNSPTEATEISDLNDSLDWIAPTEISDLNDSLNDSLF